MANLTLLDSSYLYALYNPGDTNHGQALAYALSSGEKGIVPVVVLAEAAYLLQRDIGYYAVPAFLQSLEQAGIQIHSVSMGILRHAHEIMSRSPGAEFDFVDCCLMALSEQLNVIRICTFDRHNFSNFHPKHCSQLELLP